MFPTASAVAQDVLVRAAGVFEGIGQDGQAVEGTLVVDGLSKSNRSTGWRRLESARAEVKDAKNLPK